MTQTANNYGVILYELNFPKEAIDSTREILSITPELSRALISPIVSLKDKHKLVEKIFPKEMHNFLNVLCDYQSVDRFPDIFTAYDEYFDEQNDILRASLYYVTAPTQAQQDQIKSNLSEKYGKKNVVLDLKQQPDLIGGFIIRVKDQEIDWSMRGRLNKLQQKMIWR